MTRSQTLFSLGLIVSVTLAAGCNKDEKPAPEATQPTMEQMQAAPADVPGDPASQSGIAFCDEYMTLSEKCVAEKVPEAERAGLNGLIKTMRINYKRLSVTPESKNSLLDQCKRDLEHSKVAMARYGCNWNSPALGEGAAAGSAAPAASAPAAEGDAGGSAAGDAGTTAKDAGTAAKKAGKAKAPASK